MGEHDEQIVFEMGYNKGFKDGIKGSILKADYEARLKADLVAMLTEIQLEIEEEAWKQGCASSNDREDEAYKIYYLIQQKIDSLKGE